MKTFRIQIPEKKIKFFVELMEQLGLGPLTEEDEVSADQLINDIRQGLHEVRDTEDGKIAKKTLKDLLDELWCAHHSPIRPRGQKTE